MAKSIDIMTRIKGYKYPEKEALVDRAVHFLDWCAKELPGIPISWPVIVKSVTGQARMPHIDNEQVLIMRNKSGTIRKKLMAKFARGLVLARGQGVRGTVNADDLAKTQYTLNITRIDSAKANAVKTLEILPVNEIQDPATKAFVKTSASAIKGLDTGLVRRLELLAGGK